MKPRHALPLSETALGRLSEAAANPAMQAVIGFMALSTLVSSVESANSIESSHHDTVISAQAVERVCAEVCRLDIEQDTPHGAAPVPVVIPKPKPTHKPLPKHHAVPPALKPIGLSGLHWEAPPLIRRQFLRSLTRSPAHPDQTTVPDLSWPDSNLTTVPDKYHAPHGIVGLNHGHAFSDNDHLKAEAALFDSVEVYVNPNYPGREAALQYRDARKHCGTKDSNCIAYNFGFESGVHSIRYALSQGVKSPTAVWIDVEYWRKGNAWHGATSEHNAVLQGEYDAMRLANSPSIGFYASHNQWKAITGGWQNKTPFWEPSGTNNHTEALPKCDNPAPNGGKKIWEQFTDSLDRNILC